MLLHFINRSSCVHLRLYQDLIQQGLTMTTFQILHSKGIKGSRQVARSSSLNKSKRKATPLAELGFNRDNRTRILDIVAEMSQYK